MKLRDEPCERCGWRYPGYHVCVDLSTPEPVLPPEKKRRKVTRRSTGAKRKSPEWRQSISVAVKRERAKVDHSDRDKKILEMYRQGLTQLQIAKQNGHSTGTVSKVLRQAQAAGLVDIRTSADWGGAVSAGLLKFAAEVDNSSRDAEIIKLYSQGLTQREIAKRQHHGLEIISKVLNDAKKKGLVTIRRRGERQPRVPQSENIKENI